MATITGDHVGYPGFRDLGFFFSKEKNLGEQKFACLSASNFHGGILFTVLLPVTHRVPDTFEIANYLGKNTVQTLKFSLEML